jgi:hypothetical protein
MERTPTNTVQEAPLLVESRISTFESCSRCAFSLPAYDCELHPTELMWAEMESPTRDCELCMSLTYPCPSYAFTFASHTS